MIFNYARGPHVTAAVWSWICLMLIMMWKMNCVCYRIGCTARLVAADNISTLCTGRQCQP